MSEERIVTAGLLVIGDEILSGRTKDSNTHTIAEHLTGIGIRLKEVRVIPDDEGEIVDAVNALRPRYDYVFTTGGIGPTHDDITADSIANAFGVSIGIDPRAEKALSEHYAGRGFELTPARLRMARIPDGASLIPNPISDAPGFRIGNVIVMAGVPDIMRVMLELVTATLETGARLALGHDCRQSAGKRDRGCLFGSPEALSRCVDGQVTHRFETAASSPILSCVAQTLCASPKRLRH